MVCCPGVDGELATDFQPTITHVLLDCCTRDKVRSYKFPKRERMDTLKEQWIKNCGSTPLGNVAGQEWANNSKDVKV